ncbi:MAG: helix-turn-helix domain-containing protein [Ruminococcus sp.]|nr:helix-turn-helix domain-containing protein [Ruminococcus sp.]MDE7138953.1 helix-turn-helix domain-containing protein [Ruminococcus sp.]
MQINLKAIREKNRISQNDLAEKVGVSAPYICRVEKGNQALSLWEQLSLSLSHSFR